MRERRERERRGKGGRGEGREREEEGRRRKRERQRDREREREKKINHHIKIHHDKLTDLPGGYNLSLCSIELLQDREEKPKASK